MNKVGKCLCGAVTLEAVPSPQVTACHCSMCRSWGGGPLFATACGTQVRLTGETHVRVYQSSAWAERGFCDTCGSHLFYRLSATQQYFVPAGLFQEASEFDLSQEIFVEERPDYYSFSQTTKQITGAEMFAMMTKTD